MPPMAAPSAWSKCGAVQPPSVKPDVGSSCGPPGACITPSRLVKVATMILRMIVLCFSRGCDDLRTRVGSRRRQAGDKFRQTSVPHACGSIALMQQREGRVHAGQVGRHASADVDLVELREAGDAEQAHHLLHLLFEK